MTRIHRLLQAFGLTVSVLALAGCNGGGRSAGKLDPTHAPILNNNGVMLLEHDRGDKAGALAVFRKAVELDPGYAIGWLNLGIAWFIQDYPNYKKALEAFNKAEQLGLKVPQVYFARGLTYRAMSDFPSSAADLKRAVEMEPSDAFARCHLGSALKDQELWEEAAENFQQAIKRLPNLGTAWNSLGQCLQRAHRTEEAMKAFAVHSRLLTDKTGVYASSAPYFAGLGRLIEPLADTRATKRSAGGAMVVFKEATLTLLARLNSHTAKAGQPQSAGASWGDYDNDGMPDLLLCRANEITLLHNEGGVLKPAHVTGLAYYGGAARGGSWGDYDNDGYEDVAIFGTAGTFIFHNESGARFVRLDTNPLPGGSALRKLLDLKVPSDDPFKKLGLPKGWAGTVRSMPGAASHATWADADHDGFLELLIAGDNGRLTLLQSKIGLAFVDISAKARAPGIKGPAYILPTDIDRNRAVDFVIVSENSDPAVLRNNYDGTFSNVAGAAGLKALGPCRQIAAGDFNSDGLIDYAAATSLGIQIALREHDNAFKVSPLPGQSSAQVVRSVSVADFDNDGNADILALTASTSGANSNDRLALFQGSGGGTFSDATEASGLDQVAAKNAGRIVLADVDGKGSTDILIPAADPTLLANGGNNNRWVRMNLRGLKVSPYSDHRSGARTNGSGLGAAVEAWTDATWSMTEVTAAAGDDRQPILGLGSSAKPRWVRVLWTSGVHECEPLGDQVAAASAGIRFRNLDGKNDKGEITHATHLYHKSNEGSEEYLARFGRGGDATEIPGPINATWRLWEPDRNPTSCPVLYTWDGKRYRFITDLQGGAIIGYNVGEYQYAPNDPDEYVMLPEGSLAQKDGGYELEIANQLQEILFIDAVHLLAVDHPASARVFSNDRMQGSPPFPKFKPVVVDEVRPPRSVVNDRGQDVSQLVSAADRRYPAGFEKLKYHGFAKQHTLTIDLGDTSAADRVYLLLYGWQQYAHSSSNLAAAQRGTYGEMPSVQVLDANGRWKTAIKDMGAVAGLPKWLAVDVTEAIGLPLKAEDRRKSAKSASQNPRSKVRIVTNLELYWDKIEVGLVKDGASMRGGSSRITRLAPSEAEYHWLGYPQPQFPDGREPVVYDYNQRREGAPWWAPAGYYTRTGDVTELLQKPEDKYVIMRHGHAMRVRFDPASLPPLPSGWKRDFFVMSDGFGKDMDMNGAAALTVGPLPFHKMTRYPYGANERYPDTADYRAYHAKFNTVFEAGGNTVAHWPEVRLEK